MIRLSNGHQFEYVAASGALAYDGRGWPWEWPLRWLGLLDSKLFTIVTKTLTRRPRRGNLRWWHPFRCVRFIPDGTVNAAGLTNPGIEWWCRVVGPRVSSRKIRLVASIHSDSVGELREMAALLNLYDLVGIELNASCPNTDAALLWNMRYVAEACRAVKDVSRFPLILKLSVAHHCAGIIRETKEIVEAVSINSVPWDIAFPGKKSPLARLGGGGVSGKAAQSPNWWLVRQLVNVSDVPVIGPSVWEYGDIARVRALGAQAVSFGSIFLRYPWRPTAFVRLDQRERRE